MKRIILLLAVLIMFINIGWAQDSLAIKKMYETDSLGMKAIINDIMTLSGKKFTLKREKLTFDKNGYYALYVENDKPSHELSIVFRILYKDRNLDMEREGTKIYRLESAAGNFLDIFPFWKKYINPAADAEKVSSERLALTYKLPNRGGSIWFQSNEDNGGGWKLKVF